MMALAASIATIAVGYIGLKFFTSHIDSIPNYYLWAIRFGFILFVVFSFEGFVMGSKMSHTIGAADGSKGIPFLNWNTRYGDLRIAHFIGMHALQALPIMSWYLLKRTDLTIVIAIIYAFLAVTILIIALNGISIFKFQRVENETKK